MKRCTQCQVDMDDEEAVCPQCGHRHEVTDPKTALDFLNRGIGHQGQGDLDRACADFNEALRLNPSFARARNCLQSMFLARGAAHFSQGELDKAIGAYTEAIRLNPYAVPYKD